MTTTKVKFNWGDYDDAVGSNVTNGNLYFTTDTKQIILDESNQHKLMYPYIGVPEAPYTEVEWVESNGKQYVYLDWKPNMETWGFEADFIIYNTFNSTQAAWNPTTNRSNAGYLFGVQNASQQNDIQVGTYSASGYCRIGGTGGGSASTYDAQWKKDQSRQTIKLHGTTLTCANGTTLTVKRATEVANKPYQNMTVFGYYTGLRKKASGSVVYPSSTRIYSLKFFDNNDLECDLVGAIRKKDKMTGLYDKVAKKFYPAPGMTYGNVVGDIGDPITVLEAANTSLLQAIANNITDTRMWYLDIPQLNKLEDGQKISVTNLYTVTKSYQTTNLPDWDDTLEESFVYAKITLGNGSQTEWIPCYYAPTTRLTTHYGAGQPILMTYRENVLSNASPTAGGSAIVRGLFCDPNYDTNSNTLYTRYAASVIAGKNGVKRYTLCMRDDEGNFTSIVNEANKSGTADKTAYAGGLMLSKILYYPGGSEIAVGENTGEIWDDYLQDMRYSFNGVTSSAETSTAIPRTSVYLVGTIGQDGLFYLDQTKWWTQTLPTTEDGKVYIFCGVTANTYQSNTPIENPVYLFKDGKIRQLLDGHLLETDVPADAVFTDTTYSNATQSTAGLMSSSDKTKLDGITAGATANTGTVTSVASGVGLTGGPVTTSGTIKANLVSETKLTNAASAATETSGRVYPVALDKDGKLAVNVPWTDTMTGTVANTLTTSRNFSITGGATAAAVSFNGSQNVALNVTALDATKLTGTVPLANLPAALPVAQGGTGSTSASDARTNLGITPANIGAAASTHTHAASDITGGTLDIARIPTGSTSSTVALGNHAHSNYQATLVSGTNIKTVNGISLLGDGNISISTSGTALTETEIDNAVDAAWT